MLEDISDRDREADRQMLVLALAHLAVERPGWLETCRDMAIKRFRAEKMFDDFLLLHKTEIELKEHIQRCPKV